MWVRGRFIVGGELWEMNGEGVWKRGFRIVFLVFKF